MPDFGLDYPPLLLRGKLGRVSSVGKLPYDVFNLRVIVMAPLPEIGADDFARRFSLRAANLMWFLGAGTSASAGIPTAGDMVWEFKQRLFVSQRRISLQVVSDLSSPAIRGQLQSHIDSSGKYPAAGAPDEYAALFEAVYPSESDRRAYLDAKMKGAKPSYGHIALATLMHANLARVVWMTNFDPLVADACAKVYDGTGHLTSVDLDAPDLARQCINDGRWPIEVKLHGDFRSRRLKNTPDELRLQDERLRQVFVDSCRRFGLVVAGYSGRDDSVMDALEAVLTDKGAFPAGLFWLHRGEDSPAPRVEQLLTRAISAGVEAALVRIENFDEVLRDLLRLNPTIDSKLLNEFAVERRRKSPAPLTGGGSRGWPVIRLNAIPILQSPTVCRRIVCEIGGHAEAQNAVEAADVDALIGRVRAGVLGFGSDAALKAAFEPYKIATFDLHTIETKRLRYDSGERGLLKEALARAIERHRGLRSIRKGSMMLLVPSDTSHASWKNLRDLVGTLGGTVKGHLTLRWYEGVGIRLEWAADRLWLIIDSRTVFEGITPENKGAAADFARERTVKRYNRQLNDLIAFWACLIAGKGDELRALNIGDGVDAVFKLGDATAYSRRTGA